MRISDKERNILACLEHNANCTVPEIAKILRTKEHTIRYSLGKLIDSGMILGKVPFIDMYRLGYVDYTFGISLAPTRPGNQEKFIKSLIASPCISWVAATTGASQIAFSFLGKHPGDVHDFLDGLCNKTTVHLLHQAMTIRLGFCALGRRFLSTNRNIKSRIFSYGEESSNVSIDELDHRILSGLSNALQPSDRKLAKAINIPLSTLERRIKRLEDLQVIRGYICRYKFSDLSLSGYKVRFTVRGDRRAALLIIKQIAQKYKNVLNYSIGLGNWDFEFTVEFSNNKELFGFTQAVTEELGEYLSSIWTLQVFENFKYSGYPFAA